MRSAAALSSCSVGRLSCRFVAEPTTFLAPSCFRRGSLAPSCPRTFTSTVSTTAAFTAPIAQSARFVSDTTGSSTDAANSDGVLSTENSAVHGLDSAELLFSDLSDTHHRHTTHTRAEADVFLAFGSSNDAPQAEPTTAAARDVLEQRRRLFQRCTTLREVVDAELRAEVARDMKDGVAAVPPLAPPGWRVLHPTGSSYFTLSRVYAGGDGGNPLGEAPYGGESGSGGSAPRYQSVHDMMTGKTGVRGARSQATSTTRMQKDGATSPSRGARFLNDSGHTRGDGRVRYTRSDTHVTVFAPFRTLDLTLYDPRVSICEWTRFDVLVRKCKPAASSGYGQQPHTPVTPLQGQQEVWDEGRCMFLRLACVNGELRIRSVQFLSHKLARALEEHAVFGRGEPLYLELLRRRSRRAQPVGQADGPDRWHTAASPLNVFDAPGSSTTTPSSSFENGSDALASSSSLPAQQSPALVAPAEVSDEADVLTQFDRSGEYARGFAYGGPYMTELSKELREALLEYVMMHLGVTNEVAEYVCQMQFFLEQEEYVGWLAQWGQLATTLSQTL